MVLLHKDNHPVAKTKKKKKKGSMLLVEAMKRWDC